MNDTKLTAAIKKHIRNLETIVTSLKLSEQNAQNETAMLKQYYRGKWEANQAEIEQLRRIIAEKE